MVVEGEPGIFPQPVAGLLRRVFGRIGRRVERVSEPPADEPDDRPPPPPAAPPPA